MTGTRIRTAMVLAAGLGKRLRPFTAARPKPLVAVHGKTLIDWTLDRLFAAGIEHVVINTHYLAPMLQEHLAARDDAAALTVLYEPDLLETGGGVVNALDHLGPDPFLVTNSDSILIDGFQAHMPEITACWDPAEMDALLLLVPTVTGLGYDGAGDFSMRPDGRLQRRKRPLPAPFVYTGTQVLKPDLFQGCRAEPFSLNRTFDEALASNRLYGMRHQGDWLHIGSPDGLAEAEAYLRDMIRSHQKPAGTLPLFGG